MYGVNLRIMGTQLWVKPDGTLSRLQSNARQFVTQHDAMAYMNSAEVPRELRPSAWVEELDASMMAAGPLGGD